MTEAEQGVPRNSAAARDNTGAAQTHSPAIDTNKQKELQTSQGSFAEEPSGETLCTSKPFVCIYYNTMLITGYYIL